MTKKYSTENKKPSQKDLELLWKKVKSHIGSLTETCDACNYDYNSCCTLFYEARKDMDNLKSRCASCIKIFGKEAKPERDDAIQATKWSIWYQKHGAGSYYTAYQYAKQKDLKVDLIYTDEEGRT